jgi:hypothetical protein
MRSALRLNLAWSLLMLAAFAALALGTYSNPRGVLFGIAAGYLVASVMALRSHRWAIALVVLAATLVMFCSLPLVVLNTGMFFSGHQLYQDSPGTIFVVLVNAVVFAIPATSICILFVWRRHELWSRLRSKPTAADA